MEGAGVGELRVMLCRFLLGIRVWVGENGAVEPTSLSKLARSHRQLAWRRRGPALWRGRAPPPRELLHYGENYTPTLVALLS